MSNLQEFLETSLISLQEIISLVGGENWEDIVITRLESITLAAEEFDETMIVQRVVQIINQAILYMEMDTTASSQGRPALFIQKDNVETLLSLRFTATDISRMLGVSRRTICRRLQEWNMSIRSQYSEISADDLRTAVSTIVNSFRNAGYKQVGALLLNQGIRVTERDVRQIMREVDPHGVYHRTRQNRTIRRREYFVEYSNEMWHIDTHLKLIRWKFVIRSGIDGKSRTCVYLKCGTDNKAISHLESFLEGVQRFGIPSRCRSDKGGENVLIAKFMIDSRGVGRASHICGRSVHNQRIERYWRDVFHQTLSLYYNVFTFMEDTGRLNLDEDFHLALLHFIFLPRINAHLQTFMEGWNNHPIRTERSKSPYQIFTLNLPPVERDLPLSSIGCEQDFLVNAEDELQFIETEGIANVEPVAAFFTSEQVINLQVINPLQVSSNHGIDLYDLAMSTLRNIVNVC